MLVTKSGIYFLALDAQEKPGIEFTKERSDFFVEYRQKKVKRLKHIDIRGEKAGLFGRIFKGKKRCDTLEELIKGNNFYYHVLAQDEEYKVLEIDDRNTTKTPKTADLQRATTKGDKELYQQRESENEKNLFGDKLDYRDKKQPSSASTAQDSCSEVKNQMQMNVQALNERGEKIDELQDKR